MRSLLALALIAWSLGFARGAARRLLPEDERDRLTLALTAAGLGLGAITLLPFWLMLAWPGGPAFLFALGGTVLFFLVERAVGSHEPPARQSRPPGTPLPRWELLSLVLVAAIVLVCAGIVFNATYWPFAVGDALALYAPFGKHLYEAAALPVGDRIYEAYPMLVPMAYAFTHWAVGAVNEYVARLVPALMAVGAVGAAGALGRAMKSPRTGLVASGLTALTPVFGRWASTGYADVPAALYVGLMVLFAWRWWQRGDPRALLLSGITAGLAMWTKNSTLAFLPSLVWLVLWQREAHGRTAFGPFKANWRAGGALFGAIAVVAGPWYLRNLLVFDLPVPQTILIFLIERAQHTVSLLAIMLRGDQHFGVSGWLFTAAIIYGLTALFAGDKRKAERWRFLMAFAVPFLGAWFLLASYDSRFLMTVLPVLAVMGALMIDDIHDALAPRLTPRRRHLASLALAVAVAGATLVSLRKTVEHKAVLIRTPWLDGATRHRVQLGGLYDLIVVLNGLPRASRVAGVPSIARYHLDLDRFARIDFAWVMKPPAALVGDYDYVAYRPVDGRPMEWHAAGEPLLSTPDGYRLYATRRDPGRETPEASR